jgi:polyhydroxybutyrate depolymerase
VYAAGFSNGGFMSYTLGCQASDVFAAVASVGGASAISSCAPGRAVPFFGLGSPPDTIVSFEDGRNAMLGWVERNGCGSTPVRSEFGNSFCEVWSGCNDGVEVHFCTWVGGFHFWPGANTGLPASDMIWEFFDRFPLP